MLALLNGSEMQLDPSQQIEYGRDITASSEAQSSRKQRTENECIKMSRSPT